MGPEAYVALDITIFAAGSVVGWMVWELIDALRQG
jgi:hypothetical protein